MSDEDGSVTRALANTRDQLQQAERRLAEVEALVEKWQAQAKEFRSRGYRLPALHAERLDFCADELAAVLRATEPQP